MRTLLLIFCFAVISLHAKEARFATDPIFSSIHWGAYVIDADNYDVLYSHNASKLFIPASLTKLFTTLTALECLGPDYRFHTKVQATFYDDKGTLGNLYLVGGGDPTLTTKDLKDLAHQIQKQGIKKIKGTVFSDNSLFESQGLPIHAEWEDLAADYAQEQSALSINHNVVIAHVSPGDKVLSKAKVILEQDIPYCNVFNQINTAADSKQSDIVVHRGLSNNCIELYGRIPVGSNETTIAVAIHDPTEYTRQIFISCLREVGIPLQGKRVNDAQNELKEIASHISGPLLDIVHTIIQNSDNLFAELVFKSIGAVQSPGKAPLTLARDKVASLLERIGIKKENYVLYDGSGLSRHNMVTPKQVVGLLAYAKKTPFAQSFIDILPQGGLSGSLKNRLKDLPKGITVLAKTGSMSGISNLAGYATTASGKRVIFAFLMNNSTESYSKITLALDNALIAMLKEL